MAKGIEQKTDKKSSYTETSAEAQGDCLEYYALSFALFYVQAGKLPRRPVY